MFTSLHVALLAKSLDTPDLGEILTFYNFWGEKLDLIFTQ